MLLSRSLAGKYTFVGDEQLGQRHWIGITAPLQSEHLCSDSCHGQAILLQSRQPIVISVDSADESYMGDLCKKPISENSLRMSRMPAHWLRTSLIWSLYSIKGCASSRRAGPFIRHLG